MSRGADRKRRAPLALLAVPVALVAAAVVVVLMLGGGEVPIIGGQDEEVPAFDFRVRGATAVATVPEADQDALDAAALELGDEITPTLDDLFTNAFLDPSNWRDGDYEEVFAAFAPDAAPAAEQGVEALTLGATAGDVFETVSPGRSGLAYDVLFDPEGSPSTVVATVTFRARGERRDGTLVAIVCRAEFFLRELDGWQITAFDVTRDDREVQPPASPTVSPSA